MAVVCPELVVCSAEQEMPRGAICCLPLARSVPVAVLGTRRHAFSSGSGEAGSRPGRPRMTRRCAISYEPNDVTARYIRFLGDAVSKRLNMEKQQLYQALLPELVPSNSNLMVHRRNGRRGSIRQVTAASSYKEVIKDSVLTFAHVDVQGKVEAVAGFETWNFDMFAFRRVTEGRPLFHLGYHLLHKHGLVEKFHLEDFNLRRFLVCVEEAYHPENCYHNSTHAADVTQALNCLLLEPQIRNHLTDQELLAALLAAMCHDLDHPGVNQAYLVNTGSHLAHIHGTQSVLERHHCQHARSILCQSGLLDNLISDQKRKVISLLETMILATDVSQHGDFLALFKDMMKDKVIDLADEDDRHFMLTIAIKVADISNPSRPLDLSKSWSCHIMEEFFRQGDSERKLNLPVSTFCDRYAITIPKSQSGFFEFLALPLFKAWNAFFKTEFSGMLCNSVEANKAYWDTLVAAMENDEVLVAGEDVPAEEDTGEKKQEAPAAAISVKDDLSTEEQTSDIILDTLFLTMDPTRDVPGKE